MENNIAYVNILHEMRERERVCERDVHISMCVCLRHSTDAIYRGNSPVCLPSEFGNRKHLGKIYCTVDSILLSV